MKMTVSTLWTKQAGQAANVASCWLPDGLHACMTIVHISKNVCWTVNLAGAQCVSRQKTACRKPQELWICLYTVVQVTVHLLHLDVAQRLGSMKGSDLLSALASYP